MWCVCCINSGEINTFGLLDSVGLVPQTKAGSSVITVYLKRGVIDDPVRCNFVAPNKARWLDWPEFSLWISQRLCTDHPPTKCHQEFGFSDPIKVQHLLSAGDEARRSLTCWMTRCWKCINEQKEDFFSTKLKAVLSGSPICLTHSHTHTHFSHSHGEFSAIHTQPLTNLWVSHRDETSMTWAIIIFPKYISSFLQTLSELIESSCWGFVFKSLEGLKRDRDPKIERGYKHTWRKNMPVRC